MEKEANNQESSSKGYKFAFQYNSVCGNSLDKMLKEFSNKYRTISKQERISNLNTILGVSTGLNAFQEKKIKKEALKLQDLYNIFNLFENKIPSDINEFIEQKFGKCPNHQKYKFFFCDSHREVGLMCNQCCESHVLQENSVLTQQLIEVHSFYYFPHYILSNLDEQLHSISKLSKAKDKVENICESITKYKAYIDYNYYFLNKVIDEKFEELTVFLQEIKREVKREIKIKYKTMRQETDFNQPFWFKTKETLLDEFYSYYNSVITKLTNFKTEFDLIIKNSEEKIKRFDDQPCIDLNKTLEEIKEKSNKVPKFLCLKFDFDGIKSKIKEEIKTTEERLLKNEAETLKVLIRSEDSFLQRQKKLFFFFDQKFSIKSKDLMRGKFRKEQTSINIVKKGDENLDDLIMKMVLPINGSKIYLNGVEGITTNYPKMIIIGGFYPTKSKTVFPNYFSVYDFNSNNYYLNYIGLNVFEGNKVKRLSRLGMKSIIVTKDELKQFNLTDFNNILLIGGDLLEGHPTNEVFLLKGINHILSGQISQSVRADMLLEEVPELKPEYYHCEVMKFNSFLYYFGGIDRESGEIVDSVKCIDLSNLNYKRNLKMDKAIFGFSILKSPSRGNFLIFGGLTSERSLIVANLDVIEITIKEDSNSLIKSDSLYCGKIGKLGRKRISPAVERDGDTMIVIGGEANSFIEMFSLSSGGVIKDVIFQEVFEGKTLKNSQLGVFALAE